MIKLNTQLTNTLSPQMFQYLKMLQMNNGELDAYILELYESNPLLELEKESPAPSMEYHIDAPISGYTQHKPLPDQSPPDMMDLVAATTSNESIFSALVMQVDELKLSPFQRKQLIFLIADVDENGYLSKDILRQLCDQFLISPEQAEQALSILQTLDPCGVGARSLSECLSVQLKRLYPKEAIAAEIARHHLEDVSKARYRKIAKAVCASTDEVMRAIAIIRELDPRPGSVFKHDAQVPYIRPDVIITNEGNRFLISLQRGRANRIAISGEYKQMLTETTDRELKHYLNDKHTEAQNLIQQVEMRSSTLLSCASKILEHQKGFFLGKDKSPKPYTQARLAEELGLNPSTISRTLNGKYLQCSRGIFSMSYFFPNEVLTANSEAPAGSADVSDRIAELIKNENKEAPLSDRDLQIALEQNGLYLSRRTVANYRIRLNIPSAALRKSK